MGSRSRMHHSQWASDLAVDLPATTGCMHHAVASDLALAQDGVVHACCASLEELISIGRLHSSFTCMLSLPKGESHLLEVSGATSELERSNRVIVIRDITDRVRRIEAEKEVLSAAVAREKDDEANRFTRHEVKNSVLAALTQCDQLRTHHMEALRTRAGDAAPDEPGADPRFASALISLRAGLNQTLETVLSHAMAREVIHGVYISRTVPVKVDTILGMDHGGFSSLENDSQFPVTTWGGRPDTNRTPRPSHCPAATLPR